MTATVATDLKANFKYYMDRVVNGDAVIITRPKHKNVVMISEDEYNELVGVKNNTKEKALQRLLSELKDAEDEADRLGWIDSNDVEKILG